MLTQLALINMLSTHPNDLRKLVQLMGGWEGLPPLGDACLAQISEYNLNARGRSALRRMKKPDSHLTSQVRADADWLRQHPEVSLLHEESPAWPVQLGMCRPAPAAIFVQGSMEPLCPPTVALIGSRKATGPGRQICNHFAAELARLGVGIVSGCAEGIDSAAHQGALDNRGRSLGILASGLAIAPSRATLPIRSRMLQEGTLVSEYPPGYPAQKFQFLARNRLIATMSQVVIVVEADYRSGALSTARWASECGVPVLAVPGLPTSSQSRGCHQLIRDGCGIAADVKDILMELGAGVDLLTAHKALPSEKPHSSASGSAPSSGDSSDVSEALRPLMEALCAHPLPLDVLAEKAQMSAPQAASALTELVILGIADEDGNGFFKRPSF